MKLVVVVALVAAVVVAMAQGAPIYTNKPRVRREWRTLSGKMRKKVAKAYWKLKKLSTRQGRKRYGKDFNNHDEMLMLHACATMDPRCDQGHYGPQFMTFHRALLLKYERALLAVDPEIEAMPYWHMAYDAEGGKFRDDPGKYIFTDKFFGSFYGKEEDNYTVTDGLFAYWPVAEYTSGKYGAGSKLAKKNQCIAEEWFKPSACSDDPGAPTYLRAHQDCNPYVARNPKDPAGPNVNELGGTYEIVFTPEDFAACVDPDNTPTWMDWQNCIEISSIECNKHAQEQSKVTPEQLETIAAKIALLDGAAKVAAQSALDRVGAILESSGGFDLNCTISNLFGFFLDGDERKNVNILHSQAHIKFGRDLLDVTTSPNEGAVFTAYHADIDRSNFIWTAKSKIAGKCGPGSYPDSQEAVWKFGSVAPPYGTSGPFSTYDLAVCANSSSFSEYAPLESPWLPGTLRDDVVNKGFAFFDLFDCDEGESCDGGAEGYTHGDMLYWTAPERTPYTYDTLEHLYYDV